MAAMEIIHGLYSLKPRHKNCVLTIGNFDGVHHGHQLLLAHLVAKGRELGVPSLLLTFERLERQQVLICLILVVGTTIGTLIVRPDYIAALKGSFAFGHVPEIPPWAPEGVRTQPLLKLAAVFWYVGGSVLGYVVYANGISLHGWGLTSHPQIDGIRRRAAKGRPADYLPDERIAQVVFLAERLDKPVLVEGPAGVGKTELAKAVATITGRPLIRLQC